VFEAAVVGLYSVVRVLLDVMPRRRQQFIENARVDRCLVGDHLGRSDLQHGQRPVEESAGGLGVPFSRDVHVDDLSVLVYSAVHVTPNAADLDICFVDEPAVAGRVPREAGRSGVNRWTHLQTVT
jgi:hypothetical protein